MLGLPYFELKFPVGADHFKIGAVGGNQPGTVRPRRERDEHVEMQIAQLVRCEAFICVHLPQQPARLQPIIFRGRQDAMVLLQRSQELPLRRFRRATPQLRQNHGRCPDETGQRFDSLLMTSGAQMIDKDRSVEDGEVTHRDPRTRAFPRASSSSP